MTKFEVAQQPLCNF
uniref:Uncharacterized protein n=1 Tax=Anguilla anguilla TaxID=7936 RepID=A0A0E9PSZ3_ANGAN